MYAKGFKGVSVSTFGVNDPTWKSSVKSKPTL